MLNNQKEQDCGPKFMGAQWGDIIEVCRQWRTRALEHDLDQTREDCRSHAAGHGQQDHHLKGPMRPNARFVQECTASFRVRRLFAAQFSDQAQD